MRTQGRMKPCTECGGRKRTKASPRRPCFACDGRGTFPDLEEHVPDIMAAIQGRKGLRSSPPKFSGEGRGVVDARSYFVWRLARFHGGADVTLPMLAGYRIAGDPERDRLMQLSLEVAGAFYGVRESAGGARWSTAMRGTDAPAGLPASAYPGGPAHDWRDPITCATEAGDAARMEAERGELPDSTWVASRDRLGRSSGRRSPSPEEAEIAAGERQLALWEDEES